MRIAIQIHAALSNLLSSKLRSVLALLGILVGTASVVAMVSGGQMATMQALKQFQRLGTNLMTISANYTGKQDDAANPRAQISLQTALNLKNSSNNILVAAPYTTSYGQILFNDKPIQGSLIGAEENLATILKISLLKGRFLSRLDNYSFYCVLGNGIFEKIHKELPNPIGSQIKIGENYFTIVGVLKSWPQNSFVYANVNDSVFIPIQTSLFLSKFTRINTVVLKIKPKTDTSLLKKNILTYLNQRVINQRYFFNTPQTLIKSMEKQKQIFTIFLGFIGGISLLVGGIGVMNIMLVSVIERRREIGIRLAVGATPRDISMLFLVESIILALIGGILGVALGILVSFVIAETRHWEFAFFLDPPLIGFTVSVFVGIFFGFYPAYKASKLNPIDALRTE